MLERKLKRKEIGANPNNKRLQRQERDCFNAITFCQHRHSFIRRFFFRPSSPYESFCFDCSGPGKIKRGVACHLSRWMLSVRAPSFSHPRSWYILKSIRLPSLSLPDTDCVYGNVRVGGWFTPYISFFSPEDTYYVFDRLSDIASVSLYI